MLHLHLGLLGNPHLLIHWDVEFTEEVFDELLNYVSLHDASFCTYLLDNRHKFKLAENITKLASRINELTRSASQRDHLLNLEKTPKCITFNATKNISTGGWAIILGKDIEDQSETCTSFLVNKSWPTPPHLRRLDDTVFATDEYLKANQDDEMALMIASSRQSTLLLVKEQYLLDKVSFLDKETPVSYDVWRADRINAL